MNVVQMGRARMIDSVFRHFLVELGPSRPGTQGCHAMPCRSSTCPSPTFLWNKERKGGDGGRKGAMSAPCSHRVARVGRASSRGRRQERGREGMASIRRPRAGSTDEIQPTTKGLWLVHPILNQTTSCIENGEFSHLLPAILGCFVALRFQVSLRLASSCCNCRVAAAIAWSWLAIFQAKQRHPMLKCVIVGFFCCIEPPFPHAFASIRLAPVLSVPR